MADKTYDAVAVEKETLAALKDFQRATVERVDALFRTGHKRILVADEVGLGKTVIARGVIAKTARLRKEENDDLFKVAYICSNLSIANQNVQKLRLCDEVNLDDDVTQTRLSMQHLKIARQEHDKDLKNGFVVIIPLTPETSFNVKSGWGTVQERALMCAILEWMPEFKPHIRLLCNRMVGKIRKRETWNYYLEYYRKAVKDVNNSSYGEYPASFCEQLRKSSVRDIARLVRIITGEESDDTVSPIQELRVLFATESAKMMRPDLVIMDEFQRFRFLLDSNSESETGIIANEFLSGRHDDEYQKTRILLLSATPYKLYSTPGEINEANRDEQYFEFIELVDFLFEGRAAEVKSVWKAYSGELREFRSVTDALLQLKANAESRLSEGICRTERVSVMDSGDYISDQESKTSLNILEGDVESYVQFVHFLNQLGLEISLPVDYAKSCPFLLSFLRGYEIRNHIDRKLTEYENKKSALFRGCGTLCLKRDDIKDFEPLEKTNARLEELKRHAFMKHAEKFVWVPPTLPYYPTQGAYKDAYSGEARFSKVLVFSAWEMVPRMISTLVSYEAERLTTGVLCRKSMNQGLGRANYFKNKYPPPRLRFAIDYKNDPDGKAKSLTLFTLIYPSKTLRDMYEPLRCLNSRQSLSEIEIDLKRKFKEALSLLKCYENPEDGREDASWYYLAPMLLDGVDFAKKWTTDLLDSLKHPKGEEKTDNPRGVKGAKANCEELLKSLEKITARSLGKMPGDLLEVLVDMVLGSPAVCVARGWNGTLSEKAGTEISRKFFRIFNSSEIIAIIELVYGRRDDDYWKDVLRYCKDGCFQAMFDEYFAVVSDDVTFSAGSEREKEILKRICSAFEFRSVPYQVDTAESICGQDDNVNARDLSMSLRTHYAVGFIKGKGDEGKVSRRKDSIRRSFNSPLRPFVLASTSIGQEGLDFHPYCRKIMHWNLPSNPIDLEQREGRINRYKCLAVRENIALKYGVDRQFEHNVWNEMYQAAVDGEKKGGVSDLIPFWCFGKNQKVKIERIVPKYPCSKDEAAYERLITILSLYRLSMGQPRQEELLDHVLKDVPASKRGELKKLFINLSPFSTR